MQKNSKVLNLDDTRKELKELYSKRKKQEESVKIIEQNEQYEQRRYYELDENYEPARSDIEIAEEELYDTNHLIEKKEDIYKK